MLLLRALRHLNIGIAAGEVFPASRLKPEVRQLLLDRGIVTTVSAPPIAILPGIEGILDVLVAAGVNTLGALVEAKAVDGLTAEELAFWQKEATDAVSLTQPCGCRKRR
jgi:hypothetical protein